MKEGPEEAHEHPNKAYYVYRLDVHGGARVCPTAKQPRVAKHLRMVYILILPDIPEQSADDTNKNHCCAKNSFEQRPLVWHPC